MGVVPGTLARVGEDFVGVDELLEGGGGLRLRDAALDELVRVALEGEALVRRTDFIGGAVAAEAEDFV